MKNLLEVTLKRQTSHVWMWELDYKESWAPNELWFWWRLERCKETLERCKEIKPVNPQGNQSWIFTGRTDAKAEAPILWPHDVMRYFIGRDLDAWKDWRQKRRGQRGIRLLDSNTDSMDMSEQTLGDSGGQRSLVGYSPWGRRKLDTI